jgi:hypothetical protein
MRVSRDNGASVSNLCEQGGAGWDSGRLLAIAMIQRSTLVGDSAGVMDLFN